MSAWTPAITGPYPASDAAAWYLSAPARVAPLEPTGGERPAVWEIACIKRTQQGRPEAFNPIVTYYTPRIHAYLFRMVRSHEEAEDLTQDTFLKAFNALSRFDAGRPFKRWLYTIATNTGINAIRSRKRRGTPVALDTEILTAQPPAAAAMHSDGTVSSERLESALAALPPRAAQLITLHYHEEFTLQEAGEILGISETAAKAAICRARQQLRRALIAGGAP